MPLLIRQSMTPYYTPFYSIASLYCNAFVTHQSMTLYGTPFYAIVPINCNALVTRPIYDTLRYSFLCYCIIVMKWFFCPTNLWASTVLLLCYCSNKLQCLFLSHQSMTLYGTPFYAIASLYCNALFYPTNLWPSTVLLFMLLHIPQSMTLYCTWSCRKRRKCTKWWNPWPIYDPLWYLAQN